MSDENKSKKEEAFVQEIPSETSLDGDVVSRSSREEKKAREGPEEFPTDTGPCINIETRRSDVANRGQPLSSVAGEEKTAPQDIAAKMLSASTSEVLSSRKGKFDASKRININVVDGNDVMGETETPIDFTAKMANQNSAGGGDVPTDATEAPTDFKARISARQARLAASARTANIVGGNHATSSTGSSADFKARASARKEGVATSTIRNNTDDVLVAVATPFQGQPGAVMFGPVEEDDDDHVGPVEGVSDLVALDEVGLVTAELVPEAHLNGHNSGEPVEAKAISEELLKAKRRRRWVILGAIFVLFAVVVITLLAVLVPSNDGKDEPPLSDYDYLVNVLTPISGDALLNETTPQYEALQWVAFEDPATLDFATTPTQVLIDRYVLVLLYSVTGGPAWINNLGFLSNSSVCDWVSQVDGEKTRVECNNDGTVRVINLDVNNLNGTLPDELSALESLVAVSAIGNSLYGTVPASLGDLPRLETLQLPQNLFTGTIPDSLGNIKSLEILNLNSNQLTGTIPASVTQLSLRKLMLWRNRLNGTIPEFKLNGPTNLIILLENNLVGTIPESIFTLLELEDLYLSNNDLTGTLSTKIGRLDALGYLSISSNRFSGPIPTEIGWLDSMNWLVLDGNSLNGTIPTELGELRDLYRLDLNNNSLAGPIPSELGRLTNLEDLILASNNVTGVVPTNLREMPGLELFDVSNTSITGSFDDIFCTRDKPVALLEADCLGASPEVNCSCCTECCDDATSECEGDLEAVCENAKVLESTEEEVCECSDMGTKFSCSSSTCQYCNDDGSVCYLLRGNGSFISYDKSVGGARVDGLFLEAEYVVGPVGDRFRLEEIFKNNTCRVLINDQECATCTKLFCLNEFLAWDVDCTNVRDDLLLYGCDKNSGAGALEILAGDSLLLGNCVPIS